MITETQMNELRNFPTSSWAVWPEEPTDLLEFMTQQRPLLRSDVVFLGLNRSGQPREWENRYQNFHTAGHQGDAQIKKIVQDGALNAILGGYMTDLCDVFETDSAKVRPELSSAGRTLEEQLAILGSAHLHIICFGATTYRSLRAFYHAKKLATSNVISSRATLDDGVSTRTLYGVNHYAMNGFNNRHVLNRLPGQLAAVATLVDQARTPGS